MADTGEESDRAYELVSSPNGSERVPALAI
jgi:hypothetical protein